MGVSIFSKNVAYLLVLYLSVIRVQIFHVPSICLLVVMPRQYKNRATTDRLYFWKNFGTSFICFDLK